MRILIATVQIPFVRGGAEVHAEGLREALLRAGHEAEIVQIPFRWYPPARIAEQILACRLLDLTEFTGIKIDALIGLKFPAYLIPHPRKVLWILHQHRQAYDLWQNTEMGDLVNFSDGAEARDLVRQADRTLIPEAKAVYANSRNVAERLRKYCGLDSTPLYHPPPHADAFYCDEAEDYLFFPSRLSPAKRQARVVEALALTRRPVRVLFAGTADHPDYAAALKDLAARLRVGARIEWLGHVSEKRKRQLYAQALGVVYPPLDEDYGYVTLEAMLSSKPVITATDSGGALEFVSDAETGLIAEPTAEGLARAMDTLWQNRRRAKNWGEAGRRRYESLEISWPRVVEALLAPLSA